MGKREYDKGACKEFISADVGDCMIKKKMTDEELEEKCSHILEKALSSDAEFLHFIIWVMSARVKKITSEHCLK